MRDPARIDRILDLLKGIWRENPDIRLGQLLSWSLAEINDGRQTDVFHIEDHDLEQWLRDQYRRGFDNGLITN